MKKNILHALLLLFVLNTNKLSAQKQFGISVLGIGMRETADSYDNPERSAYGLRGELVSSKLGIQKFRIAYLAMSFAYFPQSKSDRNFRLAAKRGYYSDSTAAGSLSRKQANAMLRMGFEIRQHWSDFLFINIGLEGGIFTASQHYNFPAYDTARFTLVTVNYNGDFIQKGKGLVYGEFFSVFYEFEKIYLMIQGEATYPMGETGRIALLFNAGIYYTFNKN